MANIFDGIKNLSDDEIRMEVALFSQVNFANAAKETGNKIIGGIAEIASDFMKMLGGKGDWGYDVVKVTDMVRKDMSNLALKDRQWLIVKLTELLAQKVGVEMETDGCYSNDAISERVVREAAVGYGVEKYDTFANKLEKVSVEYNKALLSAIHSILTEQSREEVIATDKMLQRALDRVSIDEKRNLQRLVMPKEFSGAGIGRVLRLERDVKYLTYVVDILGFECFDEVMIHTSTVMGAVKVLRSMSKVLMAQLVWRCNRAYRGVILVDEKLLPSYMNESQRTDNDITEKSFRNVIANRKKMQDNLKKSETAYMTSAQQLESAREKLAKVEVEAKELGDKFDRLKADKDDYVSGKMPDGETKRYYSDVNETNRQLDRANQLCEKQQDKVRELAAKTEELSKKFKEAEAEFTRATEHVETKVAALASEIKGKWTAYYYRMTFNPDMFVQLAEEFWAEERLVIEVFLKEIHDSEHFKKYKNYAAYEVSHNKLQVKVSKQTMAYILIEDGVVSAISNRDIVVTESVAQKAGEDETLAEETDKDGVI